MILDYTFVFKKLLKKVIKNVWIEIFDKLLDQAMTPIKTVKRTKLTNALFILCFVSLKSRKLKNRVKLIGKTM